MSIILAKSGLITTMNRSGKYYVSPCRHILHAACGSAGPSLPEHGNPRRQQGPLLLQLRVPGIASSLTSAYYLFLVVVNKDLCYFNYKYQVEEHGPLLPQLRVAGGR